MEHNITIKNIEHVNHNVLRIVADKPKDYTFTPGQATELAIDKDNWRDEKRPFTFTSLPEDDDLEFTIKVYPSHDGVTDKLEDLRVGDKAIIGDAWGAINYKGEGTFIAGGAGITPFLAILKDLKYKDQLKGNTLIFSNKTEKDIILKQNLEAWLGDDVHFVLTEEDNTKYHNGKIDAQYLQDKKLRTNKPVYVCGPPAMEDAIKSDLYKLGVSKDLIVSEE
ncbi:flavodoxin reductase [Winogradskyella litorisediminis]|uniref:Flavodoxin reductase n=1 Tax=Winogradskyella litorisediminis TaxID=1156618 RepID=A0ABW3N2A5_9FLAO